MNQSDKNIELGKTEIWRRQKILIASIFLFIPYQLLVAWPISKIFNFGLFTDILSFIIFIVIIYRVNRWYQETPCPKCGADWGGSIGTRGNNCTSCGQELKPTHPLSYKLSFTKIGYKFPSTKDG
jgi:predicted RNA-binding Zn-ribbon protein involved in translation (DUF1610 family)